MRNTSPLYRVLVPVAVAFGMESTRDLSTKEHLGSVADFLQESYTKARAAETSRLKAAAYAGRDAIIYDGLITGLKWLRTAADAVEVFRSEAPTPALSYASQPAVVHVSDRSY